MLELNNLNSSNPSKKKRKRVGRGTGSGWGKTAGRGQDGQKSRSGGNVRIGFEGGQMPLFRRLPKRGFSNAVFKKEYTCVNLEKLEKFEQGSTVDPQILLNSGIIKKLGKDGLKILGDGEIKNNITVRANKFTKSAEEKIKAAGGKAEVI